MAKKKTKKKRTASKKKVRRTRRVRGGLHSASLADLHAEIERRQSAVAALSSQREQLLRELAEVEKRLQSEGVAVGARKRGPGRPRGSGLLKPARRSTTRRRPKNKMTLVDALHKVLSGTTMSVTDVAEAVQKAGYRTTSPNFRTIVNQALISNADRFKNVARGKYTAK
jgi:hypothetical protein